MVGREPGLRAEGLVRTRSRQLLAWLLVAAIGLVYALLPEPGAPSDSADTRGDDAADERERLEILAVSPNDPYAGGTLSVTHGPLARGGHAPSPPVGQSPTGPTPPRRGQVEVFAGKTALPILAQRGERLFTALPRELPLGDLKIRIASVSDDGTRVRSKPFHIRVRAPSYRKLFRSLVGGVALVVLGIFFLARGVRAATSLHAAELLSGASKRRGLLLGGGVLLGALAQTTTGAIGLLSGLVSSRVMAVAPAAIACLTVPLGAAAAPLLVTGLIEPREGLLIVAMGVIWLLLGRGRRQQALAGLLLGTGLVAFGMQVFRPALEPFLADASIWRLVHDLRADSAREVAACALLGGLSVAVMHGPGPLVVLLLSVAQTTHHGDLRTLLALLAGTSAGSALAALITAPASPNARRLAKLHLALGMLGSLLAALSIDLWVFVTERLLGRLTLPMHWSERAAVSELGLSLFVGFLLSQCFAAGTLSWFVPRLLAWSERSERKTAPSAETATLPMRFALSRVLSAHEGALSKVAALAESGERRHGQAAEQVLADARSEMEWLLGRPLSESDGSLQLGGVAFSVLQLQNALDHLLSRTESMIDARIAGASRADAQRPVQASLLTSLHHLLQEGLLAARDSLKQQKPLDLDAARSREIEMNRIEAAARASLLSSRTAALTSASPSAGTAHLDSADRSAGHLSLLQVVDAYEASGNQVYRLAEQLAEEHGPLRFITAQS